MTNSSAASDARPQGRLAGRVAIVTGAAQGLGADFARAFAAEGASVVVGDLLDTAAVVADIKQAGGKAIGITLDVTDPASTREMAETAVSTFGGIHILMNNAALSGRLQRKPLMEIEADEWDRVMAVNAKGPFLCTQAVVPQMRKQNYGKIINIASGTAFKGFPMFLHYIASKGAIISMTKSIARELGDYGIRVNAISPGLTLSENMKSAGIWTPELMRANIQSRAIKKDALPSDLTPGVVFLASADSDFITGETLVIDGGSVMR